MRNLRGYLTAGIFGGLILLLVKLADRFSDLLYSFYPFMSRTIMDFLAELTAPFSGCFWQTLVLLFLALLAVSVGVMIYTKYNFFRWLGWVLAAVSVVAFLFMAIFGLNYYGNPLSESLRMKVEPYSTEDLREAAEYYQDTANQLSSQIPRKDGQPAYADFDTLASQAPKAFKTLTHQYSIFGGTTVPVKPLGWTDLYLKMGISGVTIGLTGEACVNPEAYPVTLPFTMCHEMSHRKTIVQENDANFAAFLACDASEYVQFRYSGYFMAYIYCSNALRARDPAAASLLAERESTYLKQDLASYSAFLKQYEGKTQDKATAANDTYLKAVGQEKGVESYGDVTDLLVNWYQQNWDPDREVVVESLFDPYHPDEFQTTEPTEDTAAAENAA